MRNIACGDPHHPPNLFLSDNGECPCAANCLRTPEECQQVGGLFSMHCPFGADHRICRSCLGQLKSSQAGTPAA